MHLYSVPWPILCLPILLFALSKVTTTLCDDDFRFSNCNQAFNCGSLRNISYPFWGGNRADYCGLPGFQLKCENEAPRLTMLQNTFRVLDIRAEVQILKVAREDYWNDICPEEFLNTTIDFNLFNYPSLGILNLTLYYGCLFPLPDNCTINGTTINVSFSTMSFPNIPLPEACHSTVEVPVYETAALKLDPLSISAVAANNAIKEGFELQWEIDEVQCNRCINSGGACGYDRNRTQFTCFCSDQPHPAACSSMPPGTKKNSVSLGVGLGIAGAAITGIFLGIWGYSIAQRRKRNAEQSKSKDLPTDMPPTPLSKGLTTPSTNLSQSTPSFLSSKSDLEKGSTYFGIQVFSYTELEEATDNFNPSKELGEGGFGVVYYGLLKDGREVAVKRLYENNFKRVEQFKNEIKILADIRHVNLVTLYGCTSRHSRELLLVYEYIPNGTVADHLHGKLSNSGLLTWPVRLSIAMETANALAYLHAKDIIHRDVKTNNILLDNNFRVKVADFGLSRLFPNDVTHVSTAPQGTPGYVDPEYYQCYQLTDKSDVYSFGVVLMELVSSKQAVDTNRHRHDINLANMAINRIQNHALHELVDPSLGFENDYATRRMTTTMAELAFRCLQQERDMRPSMEEVLGILRGIQNEGLGAEKAEVVDIRSEDMGLLKHIPPPLSPDSSATEKWMQIRSM